MEAYARRTLEIATRVGARRAQALAWCLLGESLLLRGRWDEAAACLRRSIELHGSARATTGQALAWQRLGEIAVYRGDAAAAEECVRRGLEVAERSPMASHLMGRLYATVALDALERREPAAAVDAIEAAAAAAERYGDCPTCSALVHPVAAEAYAVLGDAARAAERARAAEQVAGYWESGAWRAMAEAARGALARAERDLAQAEARFLAAADLFQRLGQPFDAARCLLQAGTCRAEGGAAGEAGDLLRRALVAFRELDAARAEARARLELARLATS